MTFEHPPCCITWTTGTLTANLHFCLEWVACMIPSLLFYMSVRANVAEYTSKEDEKKRIWKRAPEKRGEWREEWESAPTIECFIKMSTTKEYGKGNITSTKIILGRRMVVEGGWECQNNLIYSNLKWLRYICSAASKQPNLTKIWNCGIEASQFLLLSDLMLTHTVLLCFSLTVTADKNYRMIKVSILFHSHSH